MKKITAFLLTSSILLSGIAAKADDRIRVYYGDAEIRFDTAPEIVNERTFVPLRAIAEDLGTEVGWDGDTQTISLTSGDTITYLTIGSLDTKTIKNNNTTIGAVDAAPYIKDERTMVPVRFIAETFGMDVDWDGNTRSVYINAPGSVPYPVDKEKLSYYEGFSYIPDLGAYFGLERSDKSNSRDFIYENASDQVYNDYIKLVRALRFIQTDSYNTDIIESAGYEYEDEQIIITKADAGDKGSFVGVHPQKKSAGIAKENYKFYKNYPAVLDYGAIYGLEPAYIEKNDKNIVNTFVYYDEKETRDVTVMITDYINAMTNSGSDYRILYQYGTQTVLASDKNRQLVTVDIGAFPAVVISVTNFENE